MLAAGAGGGGVKKDTRYVARDVNTLYRAAQDRLDRKQYGLAAALFDEVERQHPYRSEAHTSELQSLMRNSYAVFCLKKKRQLHGQPRHLSHRQVSSATVPPS